MQYLVTATHGPGLSDPQQAVEVLENLILPGFEMLMKLEAQKKILAGGIPVAGREFVFVMDAPSNEELDRLLRSVPFWGVFQWNVTPLESVRDRDKQERDAVQELKTAVP